MQCAIKTEEDYTHAMTRLLALMDIELMPNSAEELELNQLAKTIADFEEAQIAPIEVSPLEALRFRMEQQGLTDEDLLPVLGSVEHIETILSGQQALSRSEMIQLKQQFEIPFAALTGISPTESMNEAR